MPYLFECIYRAAYKRRLLEMSAQKAKRIIDAADILHRSGKRNVSNKTLSTKADIDLFIKLYKNNDEYYYHNNENGKRLYDICDFIKEFYAEIRPTGNIAHYKIQFLSMVKLLPRELFPIDIGYKFIPKKENNIWRLVEISDDIAIDLMVEDYFTDKEEELSGNMQHRSTYLSNIRKWKNGEITIFDKNNKAIEYISRYNRV